MPSYEVILYIILSPYSAQYIATAVTCPPAAEIRAAVVTGTLQNDCDKFVIVYRSQPLLFITAFCWSTLQQVITGTDF